MKKNKYSYQATGKQPMPVPIDEKSQPSVENDRKSQPSNKTGSSNRFVDKICLAIVCCAIGLVALLNLLQPNRPTVSESEKRALASMPTFSFEALADGSYFAGINDFISDTFWQRDNLISLSKKFDLLRGFNYQVEGGQFAILNLQNPSTVETIDKEEELRRAFEELERRQRESKPETQPETPPETQPPVETTAVTLPETAGETTPETAAETSSPVTVTLSTTELSLTVGSGTALSFSVSEPAELNWYTTDIKVAEIQTIREDGMDLKGIGTGSCFLICTYRGKALTSCRITVTSVQTVETQGDEEGEILSSGFIYADGAVYIQAYYAESNAAYYVRAAEYYQKLFGKDTRVSIAVAPVSAMVVKSQKIRSQIADQGIMLKKIAALSDGSINFVDTYSALYDHRDEYIFLKSDHHWSQLGAYYAYTAFAKSVGLSPTPLSAFKKVTNKTDYRGSLYAYTGDERVKAITDVLDFYYPTKKCTMTITFANGQIATYDNCIVDWGAGYASYILGDNPYTVINVPENPQDKSILVFKDSFGNAMIPFLCEHYGNIYVIDPRYCKENVYTLLGNAGLDDILFLNNIQSVNAYAYPVMYFGLVGVDFGN